jgi:hypothetical protein
MKSSLTRALEAEAVISGATQPGATAVTMINSVADRVVHDGPHVPRGLPEPVR